jgi:hypothetical protein
MNKTVESRRSVADSDESDTLGCFLRTFSQGPKVLPKPKGQYIHFVLEESTPPPPVKWTRGCE